MAECWLKPNGRALGVASIVPLLAIIIGISLAIWTTSARSSAWFIGSVILAAFGLVCLVAIGWAARIPRLAYDDGELLVYLRSLTPLRVPIDAVECFFLGQGPAHPATPDEPVAKAANVIVRLAESAGAWHDRAVRTDLGQWRDGYITIRGMWCEPLSHERLNQLNRRLAEVHRSRKTTQEVL
jgi:hypothetical protein